MRPDFSNEPKFKFSIRFVLIAVIIGISAYFVSAYFLNLWPFEKRFITPVFTPRPTPDISDWKTYRNEEYGFEIKYPSDWEFEDTTNKSCLPRECLFAITKLASNQNKVDLDFHDGVDMHFSAASMLTQDIEQYVRYPKSYPGGKDFLAYEFQGSSEVESNYQVSAFRKLPNGSVVVFDWNRVGNSAEDLSYDKYLDQILSTFKFIDVLDTSTWKTYRNEQYEFEFKYPKEYIEFKGPSKDNLGFSIDGINGRIVGSIINGKLNPNNIEGIYGKVDQYELIKIGNLNWYKFGFGDIGCGGPVFQTGFADSIIVELTFISCFDYHEQPLINENQNLINQVLSTFRFIE